MEAPKCKSCGKRHWDRICPELGAAIKTRGGPANSGGSTAKGRAPEAPPTITSDGVPDAAVASSPRVLTKKRGRPRIEDREATLAHTKPWLSLGMSRATWYKRQRDKR